MSLINIGLTGINASQSALDTTGHNIVNANTPGYTRQRAETATAPSEINGGLIVGNGVQVDQISRIYDQFVYEQIRHDTSTYFEYKTHLSNISQVDQLFSQDETSILGEMNEMFNAFQTVADDPSSNGIRSTVLNDIEDLVVRFNQLYARLDEQQLVVADQMSAAVTEVNTLLENIATLNKEILSSSGGVTAEANDLLDKREEAVRELSEFLDVSVVEESSGAINVYMSGGQNLVVGDTSYPLSIVDDEYDRTQKGLAVNVNNIELDVTNQLSGGILGGLVEFKNESLSKSFNELGRVAIALADTLNDQHRLGIDLAGNIGGNIFRDVNDDDVTAARFLSSSNNATPNDRVGNVTILDASVLTADDYVLDFTGPNDTNYEIRRSDTDEVVTRGVIPNGYPAAIEFEGISVNLESGSFQVGDEFEIRPTRLGASEIQKDIVRGDQLALASPIRTDTNIGNTGTGSIDEGVILDMYEEYPNNDTLLSTFATAGELAPPVIIKFTSATTYDVLDNSDPANPVSMVPPIEDQTFVPGINNPVFSDDPGQTTVESTGANIGLVSTGADNGYGAENLTFTFTDPDTGAVTVRPVVNIPAGSSARDIVNILNSEVGVNATARTTVTLDNFVDDGLGTPLDITINGELLNIAAPDTVDADTVAREINANANLALQNIRAFSDGTSVRIESYIGEDIQIDVGGDVGADSVDITDANGNPATTVTGTNTAFVGGSIDVQLDDGLQFVSDNAGGIFAAFPTALNSFTGYQVNVNGEPDADDTFTIDYNTDAVSDNRNGINLIDLQRAKTMDTDGRGITFDEAYAGLMAQIGSDTASLEINEAAAESVLSLSTALRQSTSGVNLDEEAANLIQYELQYNASAQVIQVAQDIFDTLLSSFR